MPFVHLLTAGDAWGCQPAPPVPVRQVLDEAVGVVRAKVMATRVRATEDIGVSCDAVICEMLEVELEIAEVFKGDGKDLKTVYAPVPYMCLLIVLPGWEYVLFLKEQKGILVASEASFVTGYAAQRTLGKAEADRLLELKRLSSE